MVAEEYLGLVREMPVSTLEQLTGGLPFAVLSPHPDDETLGAGGLIAQACAQGITVKVVVLTDGSGSHPRSRLYPRQRLIELRQSEVERAAAILGLSPAGICHLGLPDTAAPRSGTAFEAAVARIIEVVRESAIASLFVSWQCDPHCDHEAAAAIAQAVRSKLPSLRLWAYPIWGWHLAPAAWVEQPPPRGARLAIAHEAALKRAAIAAHASQMTDLVSDDPDGFRFTDATLAPFLQPFEHFIEVPA